MLEGSVASDLSFVRPCLAELFRTCVYPPSLALRIEKILIAGAGSHDLEDGVSEHEFSYGEEERRTYRLFLSDGVLVVQALPESRLLLLINPEDVVAGSTMLLKKFRIKRAKRLNGHGEVVFLGIADCDFISPRPQAQQAQTRKRSAIEDLEEHQEGQIVPSKKVEFTTALAEESFQLKNSQKRHAESVRSSQASDSDDFETIPVDRRRLESNRQALTELKVSQSFESQDNHNPRTTSLLSEKHHPSRHQGLPIPRANLSYPTNPSPPNRATDQLPTITMPTNHTTARPPPTPPTQPQSRQQQNANPAHHPLLSLLSPDPRNPNPPRRSQPLPHPVFALISWISPSLLHPRSPHSPFPAKRHIKIHDRSISARHAGITVAVFCDARNFRPAVGTVAVFRGLTLQRIGGGAGAGDEVILNAYERLLRGEEKWFEDDERVLEGQGWDVKGMRAWWEERGRARSSGRRRMGDATGRVVMM